MTPQQEKHLKSVTKAASALIESKYRAGQEQHGGDLFAKDVNELIDEAILEAVDQLVYLITAKNKLVTERELISETVDN